jgi:pseudouridine synthase
VTITNLPAWANADTDRVEVDGRPLPRGKTKSHTYLLVNKPRGVICTNEDPQGRKKIIDMVPHPQRLFCVGRLDAESTGLVLLTDDGDLAQRLTHPRYEVPKTYEVSIKGVLSEEDMDRLKRGMYLADKSGETARSHAESVKRLDSDRERTRMLITLSEGRNREIRRLLARLGHSVRRLQRVALGPLRLKGVAVGQWRALTRGEVQSLRKTATIAGKQAKAQVKTEGAVKANPAAPRERRASAARERPGRRSRPAT